jgi:iron(III) transport system substrate-binding protein
MSIRHARRAALRILGSGLCVGLLLAAPGCGSSANRVVLYCAQDREFAEEILKAYGDQDLGPPVVTRFDTEANKAIGLYEDLVREARRPRCDVHWNNEILATIRLARQGVYEPYHSPAAADLPGAWQSKDHTWHAFAARARVLIVNTRLLEKRPRADWPTSLLDLTHPRYSNQVAMSKPMAGTSATQAACLFEAWGGETAKKFYRDLRRNGVQIVPGNKQVAEGVGQGLFAIGLTDTDDAIAEVAAGRPVAIIFPDRDAPADSKRGVLFIPNTVAIVRNGPNPKGARQLVDFLLSAAVEKKLAESASRHIPLNPKVNATLPKEFAFPADVRRLPVDFERAAALWEEVQTFLREEFAGG